MNYEYRIHQLLEANTAKYYMNKLGYSFKDLEPHIGRQTMKYHYDVHYRNFTKGLNAALGNRPKPNITVLLKNIKNCLKWSIIEVKNINYLILSIL